MPGKALGATYAVKLGFGQFQKLDDAGSKVFEIFECVLSLCWPCQPVVIGPIIRVGLESDDVHEVPMLDKEGEYVGARSHLRSR